MTMHENPGFRLFDQRVSSRFPSDTPNNRSDSKTTWSCKDGRCFFPWTSFSDFPIQVGDLYFNYRLNLLMSYVDVFFSNRSSSSTRWTSSVFIRLFIVIWSYISFAGIVFLFEYFRRLHIHQKLNYDSWFQSSLLIMYKTIYIIVSWFSVFFHTNTVPQLLDDYSLLCCRDKSSCGYYSSKLIRSVSFCFFFLLTLDGEDINENQLNYIDFIHDDFFRRCSSRDYFSAGSRLPLAICNHDCLELVIITCIY